MQDELRDVCEISSSRSAFAALRRDGTVVTWGLPQFGGDSRDVQGQLNLGPSGSLRPAYQRSGASIT